MLASSANCFLGRGAAIDDLHPLVEEGGPLRLAQAAGHFADARGEARALGLVRVVEIPFGCGTAHNCLKVRQWPVICQPAAHGKCVTMRRYVVSTRGTVRGVMLNSLPINLNLFRGYRRSDANSTFG